MAIKNQKDSVEPSQGTQDQAGTGSATKEKARAAHGGDAKGSSVRAGRKRPSKAALAKGTPTVTLTQLAEGFLEHLEAAGRSAGTLFSYGIEMRTACREMGSETSIGGLTPEAVGAYFESARVTRLKTGKPKAKPSVDKTRRVLRLALVWAAEQGWIERAPLPEAK